MDPNRQMQDTGLFKALPATLQWFVQEPGVDASRVGVLFGQDLGLLWGPLERLRFWVSARRGSQTHAQMQWDPPHGRIERAMAGLSVSVATLDPCPARGAVPDLGRIPPSLVVSDQGRLVCLNVGVGVFGQGPRLEELRAVVRGAMEREMSALGVQWIAQQLDLPWSEDLDSRAGALATGRLEQVARRAQALEEACAICKASGIGGKGGAVPRI